jgi:hypothetical protein
MNVHFKTGVPLLILAGGLALMPRSSFAIQRYTTLTKQQCTFCHVNMINKLLLTDAGKYYQKHHTFDGYEPKPPAGKPAQDKPQH